MSQLFLILGVLPPGRVCAGLVAPAPRDMQALRPKSPGEFVRGGGPCVPLCRRSALHPGDFLPDEKVTKESPGAAPLGTRWCEISALFALAALRSGSRRAAFCH